VPNRQVNASLIAVPAGAFTVDGPRAENIKAQLAKPMDVYLDAAIDQSLFHETKLNC
jgi:hypothetical protein